MYRYTRNSILILVTAALLGACTRTPKPESYIPKDAVAIAGINVRGLSKKIAWAAITDSKLFKEMQKRIPEKSTKDAMNRIENAGIDILNSFFVYVKTDTRFKGGNRITGLVPLSDAGKWQSYVKEVFPNVEIKKMGDRNEASLGSDMYVGWNNNLLVIINVMAISDDEGGGSKLNISSKMGQDDVSAEMANAFGITSENSILGNPRFTELETQGHDLIFWLNYEQLMTQYGGNMSEKMGGISLSNTLWKDAAFTVGFDFIKGKITGDMKYYMPDSMISIGKEFGATNADKDMIERLPSQKLDMALTMHISPAGIKSSLEKMGMLGLANEGLVTQGLSVDTVLGAFTGDMAMVMNDFSLRVEKKQEPFMGQMVEHDDQVPGISLSFVMKLKKKDTYEGLLKLAGSVGLKPMQNGYFLPINDKDSVYIINNDQYAIFSNKLPYATGFLEGSFKNQKMPDAISSELISHPWAMYLDMQQLFKDIDPGISHSEHDSLVIAESRRLINTISFQGGSFKDNAFDYHLDINFVNTEENSIMELMDYSMKINDAKD